MPELILTNSEKLAKILLDYFDILPRILNCSLGYIVCRYASDKCCQLFHIGDNKVMLRVILVFFFVVIS